MIPSWYLLIIYGIFAFLGFAFLLFNVFHVARFGLQSTKTTAVLAIYILSFLLVSIGSVFIVFSYDWSEPLHFDALLKTGLSGQSIFDL